MSFRDYIEFASQNPVCYFATAEQDQPRVRVLALWFADDTGFYFRTHAAKAVCNQLRNNQKVEVCFYSPGPDMASGIVMRVAGEVEFIDDLALKTKLLEDRPLFGRRGTQKADDPTLVLFRIYTGEAYFWTKEYSAKESEIERIRF